MKCKNCGHEIIFEEYDRERQIRENVFGEWLHHNPKRFENYIDCQVSGCVCEKPEPEEVGKA